MLKISTKMHGDTLTLVLEGSLDGPWVKEVEVAWQSAGADHGHRKVKVDLTEVTFVSQAGRRLLEQLCVGETEIVSSDLLTKSLVDEISGKLSNSKKRAPQTNESKRNA
jgi:hypothetical protein